MGRGAKAARLLEPAARDDILSDKKKKKKKEKFHDLLFNNKNTPGAPMGISIAKYDPAYIPYSVKPKGDFELVLCTDVMEHVQEDKIDEVFKDCIPSGSVYFVLPAFIASIAAALI